MSRRTIAGWIAIGLGTLVTCLWAFWGIIENFHEGWYYRSLPKNLGLMLIQYMSPMLISMAVALIAIRWSRLGGSLYAFFGLLFSLLIFRTRSNLTLGVVISWFPVTVGLVLIGTLFWLGRPRRRQLAYAVVVGLPFLVVLIAGLGPAIRVAGRFDDGNRNARLIESNGVRLIWAPAGPGWERSTRGPTWEQARKRCLYLTEDAKSLAETPQGIWRLPTVDEAVRSMNRHGRNCGGVWNAETEHAAYEVPPDKESPLWDTTSPVIYWWTDSEKDDRRAYRIVYDGGVWSSPKTLRMGSLGFRAVKPAP